MRAYHNKYKVLKVLNRVNWDYNKAAGILNVSMDQIKQYITKHNIKTLNIKQIKRKLKKVNVTDATGNNYSVEKRGENRVITNSYLQK